MPRPLRLEIPGGFYHLVNRGDRSEPIFVDDADRESFLEILGEACGKMGWRVHAYCLMPNHFHLATETPQANLVFGMKWLLGTYSARVNRRHRLKGHLFAGRYRSLIFDGASDDCMRSTCDYIHLNPSRAKLVAASEPLRSYRWSSWKDYLVPPKDRPPWLSLDRLLAATRVADTARGRGELERRMETLRGVETPAEWDRVRRGWCFGSEPFRQRLMEVAGASISCGGDAKARQEVTEAKAEMIVQEECRARGLAEEELDRRAKGDPQKVAIARRLRKETSVTLKWIANRLRMGTWTHTANCIYATTARPAAAPRRNVGTKINRSVERASEPVSSGAGVEELPVHCL